MQVTKIFVAPTIPLDPICWDVIATFVAHAAHLPLDRSRICNRHTYLLSSIRPIANCYGSHPDARLEGGL